MKPIKDWLETLPEPYRSEALEEHENNKWEFNLLPSLGSAIVHAFPWTDSKKGFGYWENVHRLVTITEAKQLFVEIEALQKEVAELKARLAEKKPLKNGDCVRVDVPQEGVVLNADVEDGTIKVRLDGTTEDEFAYFLESRLTRIG